MEIYSNFDTKNLNIHVFEAMEDWVRVIDKKGMVIFINKAMREALNIQPRVDVASFEEDIINEHTKNPRSVAVITLLTGKSYVREIHFLGKDYSVKSSPIVDKNNDIVAAVEVYRDITTENHIKRELFNTNKKMTDELKFARKIQSHLLPDKGKIGGVRIRHYYEPSEQLSGDLFDVIKLDEDKVGIYICDVVGHGVGASLLTMFVKANVQSIIREDRYRSPSSLLYELRDRFTKMKLPPSVYFTVFYGVYSRKTRLFEYVNAGHTCVPILKRNSFYEVLEAKGVPISEIFIDMRYEQHSIKLEEEDIIVFYTDGITEARNYNKEEFGIDRLIESIKKEGNILENILADVEKFSWGEQMDDIALMLVKIL